MVEISLRAHADSDHTSFAFEGESPLSFPRSRYPSSLPAREGGSYYWSGNNEDRWNADDIALDYTASSLGRA